MAKHDYRPSKYIGVHFLETGHTKRRGISKLWTAKRNNKIIGCFATEKEAATAYDIALIAEGKEPVNVLKRKP